MPNRILRDWTDSDTIDKLSWQAEVLFTRLIMKADDFGRFHGKPALLRSLLFPIRAGLRDIDIERWLEECICAGLVRTYKTEDGKNFLEILKFNQRLRRAKSKFPEPPKSNSPQPRLPEPRKPRLLPEPPAPPKVIGTYPNDAELVIAKAAERGYLMSMEEALRFLSDMKSMNWQIDGKPVRTWWKLLDGQKVRQSPDQRAAAIKESQRRKKGLPPVEEAKLDQWERYTDAQGRKWKRPLGSTDQDDWEQDGKQAVI